MNNYPQYIHIPTTVPVQRYFANPYVPINSYAWGGFDNLKPTLTGNLGVTGTGSAGQWMSLGDKAEVGLGKIIGKLGGNPTSALGSLKGGLADAVGGAVGQGLYSLGTGKFDRGTGAGKAISGVGNAVGGIVGKVNPLLGGIVKAGSGLVGGLVNRISGYHLNDATINAINSDVNEMNNTRVTDSSNESIANQAAAQNWGSAFDINDIGSWGWAAKGKVENEYNKLQKAMASGQNYMAANYDNAETNVSKNMMNNLLMNSAAFGGYFDNPFSHPGSGAVAYGIEQQNLANQQQMIGQMQQQNQMQQPMQKQYGFGGCMPFCFGGRFFSGGGSLNNHGSDFTNGLVYIENGGTHEENPYQGVPMGYDSRGVPNVVEEDEVIAPKRLLGDGGDSDYVFSNRITITDKFADKYHLPHGISVSKAVEVFTKESRETPNDPIHDNTNKKFLAEARDMQEQVKAEQQQQQMAMAQQVMQQIPPEQQQAMAQQAMRQGEMAMSEQTPEGEMMQSGAELSQPSMGAFGGNLYSNGGFFQPVNMFAYGNQLRNGVLERDVWGAITFPWLMKQLEAELSADGANYRDIVDRYNKLQDLYKDTGLVGYDGTPVVSDEVEALQKYFNDLGGNSVLTRELLDKYFDPSTHGGTTTDIYNKFTPDRIGGGYTAYLRNAGMMNTVTPEQEEQLNTLLGKYGIRYYKPENDPLYRFELSGLSENELRDFQNQEQEAYTPAGNGSNPEEDADDRYQFVSANGGRYTMPWLSTAGRDLPIWEAGLARLLDDIGLGTKPDYTYANGLEELARQSQGYMPVSYNPTGERMRLTLFDPYQLMLNADAQYGTASRAIQDNSNGNGAAANAAQVALARNAMMGNGAIGETGQKFNADQYRGMLDFNRTTDMQNSQGILSADAQNAHNWAQARNLFGYRKADALQARRAEKDAVDAIKLNNRKMFTDAVSKKAKENMYFNMVNHNPANGGYGMDPRYGSVIYNGAFENGTPWWGNPNTRQAGQRPTMATNPYVQNQPFNFGSFLNGLFNPYG